MLIASSHSCVRTPGDWSELTQLEVIRLDQNNIAGELPPSWSALTGLRTLTLWDNKLTGEIPESWAQMQVGKRMSYNMAAW
jgi:hypothetical protein